MNTELAEFMTEIQAAQLLGLAPGTLAVWRCTGRYKMPFIRVGRLIRYRPQDLRKWAENRSSFGREVCHKHPAALDSPSSSKSLQSRK